MWLILSCRLALITYFKIVILLRKFSSDFKSTRPTESSKMIADRSCVLVFALSLCTLLSTVSASCKYSVDSYTTTDAMVVTEAAFIAQVSVECEDSPANLYAEVEGKLVVAANAGPNKYQVSTTAAKFLYYQIGTYPLPTNL